MRMTLLEHRKEARTESINRLQDRAYTTEIADGVAEGSYLPYIQVPSYNPEHLAGGIFSWSQ
jgi:hypothetical protein